jgi:hypothetical protein
VLGAEVWLSDQDQILFLAEENKQRACRDLGPR